MGTQLLLDSFAKRLVMEAQDNLGEEHVKQVITESEFCEQRIAVERLNQAFSCEMDQLYCERKDGSKGYAAQAVVQQDRIMGQTLRFTRKCEKHWCLFLAGGP